jgi:hypothetical protein
VKPGTLCHKNRLNFLKKSGFEKKGTQIAPWVETPGFSQNGRLDCYLHEVRLFKTEGIDVFSDCNVSSLPC